MGEAQEPDWQLKFIGEEQRHKTTEEELRRMIERAAVWERAYWALVAAVGGSHAHR